MFRLSQLILCLPHGNADDERAFSYMRKNCTDFRASLSKWYFVRPPEVWGQPLRPDFLLPRTLESSSCYQWQPSKKVLKSARLATLAAVKKHRPITHVPPWYWQGIQYYIASYRSDQVYRTAFSLKFPLLLFSWIKKFKVLLWPDDSICLFKYTFMLNYYMAL